MIYISEEAVRLFDEQERARSKPRVMTMREYRAWTIVGDTISYPSEANAFPDGITIIPDGYLSAKD